jgi:UDP-N-acetylglucosamine 4,6-dehydratase
MQGGEIFVPKIPSVNIMDIAKAIAPEAKTKIIGIRPGEKINETLISKDEARHTREYSTYFTIEPEHPFWKRSKKNGGKKLATSFEYASGSNDDSLTVADIQRLIKKLNLSAYEESETPSV